jgi:hypothetical protein
MHPHSRPSRRHNHLGIESKKYYSTTENIPDLDVSVDLLNSVHAEQTRNWGWIPERAKRQFSSPQRSGRRRSPTSLLSTRYRGLFQRSKLIGMKLTTYLHLEARVRMRGYIPLHPHTRRHGVVLN